MIFLVRAWYRSATGGGMRDANSVSETSAFRSFWEKRTSVAFLSVFIISEWYGTCFFGFLLRGMFTSFGCDGADLSRRARGKSAGLLSRAGEEEEPHQRGVCA